MKIPVRFSAVSPPAPVAMSLGTLKPPPPPIPECASGCAGAAHSDPQAKQAAPDAAAPFRAVMRGRCEEPFTPPRDRGVLNG